MHRVARTSLSDYKRRAAIRHLRKADPWEFENLADDPKHADQLAELKSAFEDWRKRTGDFSPDRRRPADNTNRVTGVKSTKKISPLVE